MNRYDNYINLPAGIPQLADYLALIKTSWFQDMERFSDGFLRLNQPALRCYGRIWDPDPLHHWSKQWEYPFTYRQIADYLAGQKITGPAILDAGSGITFLPYYLKKQYPDSEICCCDQDEAWAAAFAQVNRNIGNRIPFIKADLRSLPYADRQFDIIYCLSVFEHTSDFASILRGFQRTLKNQGRLILSFDISLDGKDAIPVDRAQTILDLANNYFEFLEPRTVQISEIQAKALTNASTISIKKINKQWLPWQYRYSQPGLKIKYFIKKAIGKSDFRELTFMCLVLGKTKLIN